MALNDRMLDYYRYTGPALREAFDSFNKLEVVESSSLFDLKSVYGLSDLRDRVTATGSGSVSNANGVYTVSTGTTTGSNVKFESVERGRYVAGFEATPGIDVQVPVAPTGDQTIRWGYFDDNDGFGILYDSTGIKTFIRRGGVERTHTEAEMAGDLPDSFDVSNHNIYRFPFRWYGAGPAKFEVSSVNNSLYPTMTRFDLFESEDGETITEQSNLPICVEIDNGSSTDDLTVEVSGRQFFVNGTYNPSFRTTSEYRIAQSVGTTFVPLIAFQQKSGSFEAISIKLNDISFLSSTEDLIWQIRIGATLDVSPGATPSEIPATETGLQVTTAATTVSGGQKIQEGLASSAVGQRFALSTSELQALALPDDQNIVLCARSVTGTATVTSSFSLKEEW